jgi:hypothetical protein
MEDDLNAWRSVVLVGDDLAHLARIESLVMERSLSVYQVTGMWRHSHLWSWDPYH